MNIVLHGTRSCYTSFVVFLVNYMGKDSFGTIFVSFRDPGQILKIRDCPGESGTVGESGESGTVGAYASCIPVFLCGSLLTIKHFNLHIILGGMEHSVRSHSTHAQA